MKRLLPLIIIIAFGTLACSKNANSNRGAANTAASNSNQSANNTNQPTAASPAPGRGQDELSLGGGKISVEYGRPPLNNRDLEAQISPGQEWRMGSNDPTTLTTDVGLKFGDKDIAPGKYILKAKLVEPQKWVLLIQAQDEKTVAEVPMSFQKIDDSAELMTIDLQEKDNGGRLFLHWGNLTLSSDFQKA